MTSRNARPDLAVLLDSWESFLRAERTSPATVKEYTTGVLQYLAWCSEPDVPGVLYPRQVARFADQLPTRGQRLALCSLFSSARSQTRTPRTSTGCMWAACSCL